MTKKGKSSKQASKQQPNKPSGKQHKKKTKGKQQNKLMSVLNGRVGIMLFGATFICIVLMGVAVLPLPIRLLVDSSFAQDYVPTLVAAPLVEAVISTPTAGPATARPVEEEPDGVEDVVSLPLVPSLEPTPDGAYREQAVPILMYHYVSVPPEDADIYRLDLSVTPEQLADQLSWLDDNGYTTISLYELVDWLANGTELPDKPVVLTFDDGYADNYENAFPLLQEHGQVGTFFVLTSVTDAGDSQYMSWDMLREMVAGGQYVEMHAHEHLDLAGRDPSYLRGQVADSADIMEQRLGYRPRFLAYPGGSYDDATIEALKEAGYWLAVTTRFACLQFTGEEYELPRIRVRGDYSLSYFADLVSSAFEDDEFCYGWAG